MKNVTTPKQVYFKSLQNQTLSRIIWNNKEVDINKEHEDFTKKMLTVLDDVVPERQLKIIPSLRNGVKIQW